MTLQEYKTKYIESDDTEFETPTRELAEAWLDAKIDAKRQMDRICHEQNYDLAWGEFDEEHGDFANKIEVCGMTAGIYNELQIYHGIDLLADLLGAELKEEKRNDDDYRWEYSFDYKGVNINQINHHRLNGFGEDI